MLRLILSKQEAADFPVRRLKLLLITLLRALYEQSRHLVVLLLI